MCEQAGRFAPPLAPDRLEELRALLERDYSVHPPPLLKWLRVRLGRMD
jgi:hypothetical protein